MRAAFESFRQLLKTAVCTCAVVQGHSYRGTDANTVTALYLGTFAGEFLRFNIDAGDFHWRVAAEIERIEPEGDHDFPLTDVTWPRLSAGLPVVAATLEYPSADVAVLTLMFADQTRLVLHNAQDQSRLSVSAGAGSVSVP